MLKTIIVLCQRARTHEDDADIDEDQSMSTKFIDGVLNLFLFTWFIAGNIWVYSKYKPNPIPLPSDPLNYCNPTLYMFAFWVITASYILMGSICFCICCLGVCASCTAFFVTAKDQSGCTSNMCLIASLMCYMHCNWLTQWSLF